MAISSFEIYVVASEDVTCDMIVWQRYKQRAPGIVELMLDLNPHLARTVHKTTPFIPVGTYIRVPIDVALLRGKQPVNEVDSLWTDKAGYTVAG